MTVQEAWRDLVKTSVAATIAAIRFAAAVLRTIWRELTDVTERVSHLGHGPTRWPERTQIANPYAGAGPIPDDDLRPQERV